MSKSQPPVTELTESKKRTNRAFSREPYRVTKCHACGDERSQRMNDA